MNKTRHVAFVVLLASGQLLAMEPEARTPEANGLGNTVAQNIGTGVVPPTVSQPTPPSISQSHDEKGNGQNSSSTSPQNTSSTSHHNNNKNYNNNGKRRGKKYQNSNNKGSHVDWQKVDKYKHDGNNDQQSPRAPIEPAVTLVINNPTAPTPSTPLSRQQQSTPLLRSNSSSSSSSSTTSLPASSTSQSVPLKSATQVSALLDAMSDLSFASLSNDDYRAIVTGLFAPKAVLMPVQAIQPQQQQPVLQLPLVYQDAVSFLNSDPTMRSQAIEGLMAFLTLKERRHLTLGFIRESIGQQDPTTLAYDRPVSPERKAFSDAVTALGTNANSIESATVAHVKRNEPSVLNSLKYSLSTKPAKATELSLKDITGKLQDTFKPEPIKPEPVEQKSNNANQNAAATTASPLPLQ